MIAAYATVPDDASALEHHLTPAERARLARLGTRRRAEHLVSRALAKYLFLHRGEPVVGGLREIPLAELERSPATQCRELEIYRDDAAPVLAWRGVPQADVRLSFAHADGYCVAALSEQPIGVDVARVEPRAAAFYRVQFSEHERVWASGDDVLYTLLWAVKESLVKAGAVADPSLWAFDEIDVRIGAPALELSAAYARLRDGALVSVAGRASVANHQSRFGITFARIAQSLFSFVTLEDACSSQSGAVRVA